MLLEIKNINKQCIPFVPPSTLKVTRWGIGPDGIPHLPYQLNFSMKITACLFKLHLRCAFVCLGSSVNASERLLNNLI